MTALQWLGIASGCGYQHETTTATMLLLLCTMQQGRPDLTHEKHCSATHRHRFCADKWSVRLESRFRYSAECKASAGQQGAEVFFCCRRDAAEALPASLNGVPDGAMQPLISAVPDAGQPLPASAEATTGWAEQGMQIDDPAGMAQDDMVAAKFKPGIKFKLGM